MRFFFSSRRRHTRWPRDWSSDVCSSDLTGRPPAGTGPILASVKCDYKMPLTYPDTIDVGTRVAAIGNSSIRMEQIVVSRRLQAVAAQAVAASVESTVVLFDYKAGRPVRVPDEVREAIAGFEGRADTRIGVS